jgi:hypothetical protein
MMMAWSERAMRTIVDVDLGTALPIRVRLSVSVVASEPTPEPKLTRTSGLAPDHIVIIPLCVSEVPSAMRVEWLATVCHIALTIHDVVPVPRAIRLTNTAEVDIGAAVSILRYPDVVAVLVRYTGFLGDGALVVLATLRLSANSF